MDFEVIKNMDKNGRNGRNGEDDLNEDSLEVFSATDMVEFLNTMEENREKVEALMLDSLKTPSRELSKDGYEELCRKIMNDESDN